MPVLNAVSFLNANRHCNKSSLQATKKNISRAQTIASTPQTGRTLLQQAESMAQQAAALSLPPPLDSTPAGCLSRPQPVSQKGGVSGRQSGSSRPAEDPCGSSMNAVLSGELLRGRHGGSRGHGVVIRLSTEEL